MVRMTGTARRHGCLGATMCKARINGERTAKRGDVQDNVELLRQGCQRAHMFRMNGYGQDDRYGAKAWMPRSDDVQGKDQRRKNGKAR